MNMDGIRFMRRGKHAAEEAEFWFAHLLRSDCPVPRRRAFERWLAADPAHATAYREVEQLWALGGEVAARNPAVMAAAQRALQQPRESRARWPWIVPAAVAAALIVALLVAHPWLTKPGMPPGTRYATHVGQLRTVTLADGSSMLLDTDSVAVVRYDAHTRRIDLVRGRAQFHDLRNTGQRPFVVHAEGGTVTATGTIFQVGLDRHRTEVTLLGGTVVVDAPASDGQAHSVTLDPGQEVAFSRSRGIGPVQKANLQVAKGWPSGKLFVHDWRLPRLLAAMNRYSTTKVVIGDPSLAAVRIGGVFHPGDQHALILALAGEWGIGATRVSPTRVVLHQLPALLPRPKTTD